MAPLGSSALVPFVGAGILVLVWGLVSLRFHVTVFPSPLESVQEAARLLSNAELFQHTGASLFRLFLGFALGSALAIPVGFGMGLFLFVRRMMEPITEFFRFIPAIALVVFALIWFGIGEASKVFLIVYNAFFTVAMNTEAGVAHVLPNRMRAVQSLGGGRWDTFRLVVVPSVVPYILTGMRLGMGRSFATIVSAEILAANSGLGYLIYSSREYSKMDTVVVAIVLLGALGLLADRLFRGLARRLAGGYLPAGDAAGS